MPKSMIMTPSVMGNANHNVDHVNICHECEKVKDSTKKPKVRGGGGGRKGGGLGWGMGNGKNGMNSTRHKQQ